MNGSSAVANSKPGSNPHPSSRRGHPRGIPIVPAPPRLPSSRPRPSRSRPTGRPTFPPTGSRPTSPTWRATGWKGAAPARAASSSPRSISRTEFKKAGLKPIGKRGTYFQPVPLVRVVTSPKSTLRAMKGETTLDIPCEEGFSGTSQTQKELEEFDAEAIFVGHGITAPEFAWDDYKGIDVKGKVVVLFTNEPPSDDPKFFGGKALTYYGRWTYKFEEAARRGAKACFIIHTNGDGGLPVLRRPAARRRAAQARAGQARAGLRRLAHQRGGRETAGPVRPHGGGRAERGRHEGVQAVLARRQPEGAISRRASRRSSATTWSAWRKAATRR